MNNRSLGITLLAPIALFRCMLFLVFLLLLPATAAADSAPLRSVGRTLQPRADTSVRLVEEEVVVKIRPVAAQGWGYRVEVEARFLLAPERDEKTLVGFPLGMQAVSPEEDPYYFYSQRIEGFAATVDGKPLAHRPEFVSAEKKYGPSGDWAVWELDFRRGQPVNLVVTYTMPLEIYRPWAPLHFSYVLRTGAAWKGTIGRARVTLELDEPLERGDVLDRISPGYRLEAGKLAWDFKELEPDFDLEAAVRNLYFWKAKPRWVKVFTDPAATPEEVMSAGFSLMQVMGTEAWETEGQDLPLQWVEVVDLYHQGLEAYRRVLRDSPADPEFYLSYLNYLHTGAVKGLAGDLDYLRALKAYIDQLSAAGLQEGVSLSRIPLSLVVKHVLRVYRQPQVGVEGRYEAAGALARVLLGHTWDPGGQDQPSPDSTPDGLEPVDITDRFDRDGKVYTFHIDPANSRLRELKPAGLLAPPAVTRGGNWWWKWWRYERGPVPATALAEWQVRAVLARNAADYEGELMNVIVADTARITGVLSGPVPTFNVMVEMPVGISRTTGKPGPDRRSVTFTLDPRAETGLVVEARELTPLARAAIYWAILLVMIGPAWLSLRRQARTGNH